MKRYIKASQDSQISADALLKDCIKYGRNNGYKITAKNGGIEIYRDDDPADISARYAYIDDLQEFLLQCLESGYEYDDVLMDWVYDFDGFEFISTSRGWMTRREFNNKRKELRYKYLKIENSTKDNFSKACTIFEEIFSIVSDKPFDESCVVEKSKNKYIFKGCKVLGRSGYYYYGTFISSIDYSKVFTESEIAQLQDFDMFELTGTGLIYLGEKNRSIAKKYNNKLKQYVNSLLEKFKSSDYTIKLLSGSGNLMLEFNKLTK